MGVRISSATSLLICAASCADPPSGTFEVSDRGGIITSADGLFELEYASDVVVPDSRSISIRTRDDLSILGGISRVYEVTTTILTGPTPAEARIELPGLAPKGVVEIARVAGDRGEPIAGSIVRRSASLVSAPITGALAGLYVARDVPYLPCDRRGCGEGCSPCPPGDEDCPIRDTAFFCGAEGICSNASASCPDEPTAGWDDAPGSGRAFVAKAAEIADARIAADLDGFCAAAGNCSDNAISVLRSLANDQIRQGVLGGESLILVELTGWDAARPEEAQDATLRLYSARDADDPFFPANNFQAVPGDSVCCEFEILAQSLDRDGRARARIPVRIDDRGGYSLRQGRFVIPIAWGVPPYWELVLEKTTVHLTRRPDEPGFELIISGVITFRNSSEVCNPYCRTINEFCRTPGGTLLDLFNSFVGPYADIDLDGDGLEAAVDTDDDTFVDRCFDGCTGECDRPPEVESSEPLCVRDQRMADGYSASFRLGLLPAKIVGVQE
jgi:hypothetical protein